MALDEIYQDHLDKLTNQLVKKSAKLSVNLLGALSKNSNLPLDEAIHRPNVIDVIDRFSDVNTRYAKSALKRAFTSTIKYSKKQLPFENKELNPVFDSSEYVDSVISDIDNSFSSWKADLLRFLPLYGVNTSVQMAGRKLNTRLRSGLTVIVSRTHSEVQLAQYMELAHHHPELLIKKVWKARPGACKYCKMLDGNTRTLQDDFPHLGLELPVYFNLLTPPRHINCRCYIESNIDEQPSAVETFSKNPPGQYETLSSEDIRDMDSAKVQAVTSFFNSAISKFRQLVSKINKFT